jgi:hypothetical protein
MAREEWRDVIWYEDRYKISDLWNCYSILSCKLLKVNISSHWYWLVWLRNSWKTKTRLIHHLVWEAFIWKKWKLVINHIDWDKLNNRIDNLEYCTHSQNTKHAYDTWLIDKKKISGKNSYLYWMYWKLHHRSRSVCQYTKEGEFIEIWDSIRSVQREMWIWTSNICANCNGKVKSAWWYIWKYD